MQTLSDFDVDIVSLDSLKDGRMTSSFPKLLGYFASEKL